MDVPLLVFKFLNVCTGTVLYWTYTTCIFAGGPLGTAAPTHVA